MVERVTLTTVGYGDAYPVTVLGRILGGITALCAVGVIAMPTGILAAAFSDAFQRRAQALRTTTRAPCPLGACARRRRRRQRRGRTRRRAQHPVQTGLRFSAKARGPSSASVEARIAV